MRDKVEGAIKNLGNGTKKAGRCGLLRVVISHPALTDSNTLEEATKGSHPLATVPLGFLEPTDSDLGQTSCLTCFALIATQRAHGLPCLCL